MKKQIIAMILVLFLISGCGTVSQKDYDTVVAERDYYKQQYEQLSGRESSTVDSIVDENVDESVVENPTETTMIVEVTIDNYKDYFEFIPVPVELVLHFLNGYIFC